MKRLLRSCLMLSLAGSLTAVMAQGVLSLCNSLPPAERESARAIGACRELAPIVDVAPRGVRTAPPGLFPVSRVVGLAFDDARDRLAGFTVRRSYARSAEPGGTVVEQQPAPPARLAAGSVVRVVLSDGTLRPAPRVAATEIDGVRKPPEAPAGSTVAQGNAVETRVPSAQSATLPPLNKAGALDPSAGSKAALPPRSAASASRAPVSRSKSVQIPAATAVATSPTPVVETFELPNVIGRSSAAAGVALAEFKVERIDVVAGGAPSGQVLAQDPPPGTPVRAGSAIGLRVSDGSLAGGKAAVPPPVAPASLAASAPSPSGATVPVRVPVTFPGAAVFLLIAGVLLGLGFGAVLMRRWLAKPQTAEVEARVTTAVPPTFGNVVRPPAIKVGKTRRLVAPSLSPAPRSALSARHQRTATEHHAVVDILI